MEKKSYHEGWGFSDTVKLLIKGKQADRNAFYKELKVTFPTDDIAKVGDTSIEAFIYERQIPVVKKMATFFKMKVAFKDGGSTENLSIAKIIVDQLGGQRKLVLMTGAYNFTAIKDGVTFKIKNRKVNYIKVVLNSKDLYNVTFSKTFKETLKKVSYHEDVYFDELIPLFEKQTGMYLKFEKGGSIPESFVTAYLYEEEPDEEGQYEVRVQFFKTQEEEEDYFDEESVFVNSLSEAEKLENEINNFGYKRGYKRYKPKYKKGGSISIADANPYIAGAKAVQGIAPKSVSAFDTKMANRINPDPNRPVFFAKGGVIVTSISEIPNFKQRLEEGKISYRGMAMADSKEFYKLAGEGGTRIKVDGKEYYITDTEFNSFSRGADGRLKIRFEAPVRRN